MPAQNTETPVAEHLRQDAPIVAESAPEPEPEVTEPTAPEAPAPETAPATETPAPESTSPSEPEAPSVPEAPAEAPPSD